MIIRPERLVIVSDLHLGAGPSPRHRGPFWDDLFDSDQEFDAFASWLIETGASRIVLLGDTIDFHRVPIDDAAFARSAQQAVGQLDRVARAHPQVFGALARLLDAGLKVDVVVGNHDVELARPEVQQRFADLAARSTWRPSVPGESLRFHNWFLYLPGLLYAEHGNNHHDVQSFDRPLHPFVADRVERPLAVRFHSVRLLVTGLEHYRPPRRALLADLAPGHRVSRRLRHAYRREALPRFAEEVGLPVTVVDALHQLGSPTACSVARRVLALRLFRLKHYSFRSYAPRRAAAILELLGSAGCSVPYCVFGHTHVAHGVLPSGNHGGYLNCGTWATDQPRLPLVAQERGRITPRTWIEVACNSSGETSATLLQWTPHGAVREPVSPPGPSMA